MEARLFRDVVTMVTISHLVISPANFITSTTSLVMLACDPGMSTMNCSSVYHQGAGHVCVV